MARISPSTFLERIPDGVAPLVFFVGDSQWEKKHLTEQLVRALGEDVDLVRFEAARTPPSADEVRRVVADLGSAPVFSSRRVIVVADGDGLWKVAGARLIDLVRAQAPRNVAVMLSGSAPDAKELRKLGKHAVVVLCAAPMARPRRGDSSLQEWLTGQAGELGLQLTREAARLLIETAGASQHLLSEELEKLVLYLARGQEGAPKAVAKCRVTADAVRAVVADTAGRGLDRLLEALYECNAASALATWRTIHRDGLRHWKGDLLTGDGVNSIVMNGLADRYRKILGVIESRQVGSDDIGPALRIKSAPFWNRLEFEARRLGRSRAEEGLRLLYGAERAMRLEGRAAPEVIEETIIRLAVRSERAGRRG